MNIHTRNPKHTLLSHLRELRIKLTEAEQRESENLNRKDLLEEAIDDTKRQIKAVRQGITYKDLK